MPTNRVGAEDCLLRRRRQPAAAQRPLPTARRAAHSAHFNDAFAGFQKDLSALLSKLKAAKQTAGSLSLPDASRFYEALVPEVLKRN